MLKMKMRSMHNVVNNPVPVTTGYITRRAAMTTSQLQFQAREEWSRSPDIKCRYHTFEYYWAERYERMYRLSILLRPWWKLTHCGQGRQTCCYDKRFSD
jgi:hypothetical protein